MATITKGITFGSTEQVTATKLHNLVDLGTVTEIVNADISSSAAIADTKFAQITTANKISSSAITDIICYDGDLVTWEEDLVYYY